ncbi:Hypothetical predicted protein [Cloeon dipterum]|uniref:Uncharacterized protein n=1 Tax=Cloeon dipterum TaxID=197152 RepID=A0A8S1E2X2_9INSE|nr:Hypothetical predicted protein [Cloeon dipterum]
MKNRGETPMLLFASKVGDLEICRYFVGIGAHVVGTVDKKGSNVFHYAARNATHGLELLEYFASLGGDIKRRNEDEEGAIIVAVKEGNYDFAIKLFGLRIASMSFISYCIGHAVGLDILKSLYEKNASVVFVSNKLDTMNMIIIAAKYGDLDIMKWVFEICRSSLEDRNNVINEIIILAALKKCGSNMKHGEQIIRFLMEKCSLNLYTWELDWLLKSAFWRGNIPVADFLMKKHGAFILDRKSFFKELICNEYVKVESIGDFLKLVGKKVDELLTFPLHFAAKHSRPDVCEWMVRQGLDVAAVETGQTALHISLGNGRLDLAEELIENGADLDVDFRGCNLLLYCVGKNRLSSAKFVYEKKESLINGLGPLGETALHIATEFKNSAMLQWLIKITTPTLTPMDILNMILSS